MSLEPDIHSVKAALIDARRIVKDDIKDSFHLIGAAYDQGIFATFTHIVDVSFDDDLMTASTLR